MADKRLSYFRCVVFSSLLAIAYSSTVPPIQLCGAANYDVWNLTSKIWRFSVPGDSCLRTKTGNRTVDGCEITMAFCKSVNLPGTCADSAVCETYSTTNDTYNLATYKLSNNPFNTTGLPSNVGFSAQNENGETYTKPDNTTCTLKTVMLFYCNGSAVWDVQNPAEIINVPGKPSVNLTLGPKLCTYTLTFGFAGACPVISPSKPVNQLSPGSVLLLIFFASVIAYFVLGSFINVARGKTGQGVIPHQEFWTAVPGYIKDGFQYTLSCGGRTAKRQTYENI